MLVDVTTALIRTIFLIYAILRERFIFVAGYIYAVSDMKRYMVHLQNTLPYTPKDATALLQRARKLVSVMPVFPKNTLSLIPVYLKVWR
jgi:hypothetical protein